MLKGIISITGKAGLYKLLSRGKNNLIVENITTGKRMPTYPHEKVISLPDISIYTEGGDVPLPDVLEKLYAKADGKFVVKFVDVLAPVYDKVLSPRKLPHDSGKQRRYRDFLRRLYPRGHVPVGLDPLLRHHRSRMLRLRCCYFSRHGRLLGG